MPVTGLDSMEAIIALLLAQPAIAALTATRIYGPPGMPDTYRGDTQAIQVAEDGGPTEVSTALSQTAAWLHCYGPTAASARGLQKVVTLALNGLGAQEVTVTGGRARLQRCWKWAGPQDVNEPETGWKRCVVGFRFNWLDRVR